MDTKTLAKLCNATFEEMDKYSPLMINKAAEKLGIEVTAEEKLELEELISKALYNFSEVFADYYIYTDDDED